ncbi:hypothetical protein RHMOL_Rhmol09G0258900 [Rhododendron molle]|uniref:Uncharacterized protein n=1 Tax=Rhododendron molle TaxID=49168 RepID=A0ACC0MH51_RHOML|nr:hypothetical protein RHMOL_Rhmol09G0258900 [Rhododendron molle]
MVGVEDFAFVLFSLVYIHLISRIAFSILSPNAESPVFASNNKILGIYVSVGALVGLFLPIVYIFEGIFEGDKEEQKMLREPRRLYAPGRLYHIVERKPFRCGRFPPVVRTAVPLDGRFEHIVPSCNATSDHAIVWPEREAQRALNLMLENDSIVEIPVKQKMERQESLVKEHTEEYKAAMQRAVTLSVPHAYSPSQYGTLDEHEEGEQSDKSSLTGSSKRSTKKGESWGELIERLFDRDESGHMVLKKSPRAD